MTIALADIGADATLLTVNKQLAAEMRSRYDAVQLARGHRVWPSADILPWNAWLNRLYTDLLDSGQTELDLLTPMQERALWQHVIESATDDNPPLMQPRAAAEHARAADGLCHDWQLDTQRAALQSAEAQIFLRWQRRFNRLLGARGFLSAPRLAPLLSSAFLDLNTFQSLHGCTRRVFGRGIRAGKVA